MSSIIITVTGRGPGRRIHPQGNGIAELIELGISRDDARDLVLRVEGSGYETHQLADRRIVEVEDPS